MRDPNSPLLDFIIRGVFFRSKVFFSNLFNNILCILFCVPDK